MTTRGTTRVTARTVTNAEPDAAAVANPDAVASAVLACPRVVGLRSAPTSGVGADVATYLPKRRVEGVRLSGPTVTVQVVGWFGPTVAAIADEVRRAVRTAAPAAEQVDVIVDDLLVGPELATSRKAGQLGPAGTFPPTGMAVPVDDGPILALAGRRSPAFGSRSRPRRVDPTPLGGGLADPGDSDHR